MSIWDWDYYLRVLDCWVIPYKTIACILHLQCLMSVKAEYSHTITTWANAAPIVDFQGQKVTVKTYRVRILMPNTLVSAIELLYRTAIDCKCCLSCTLRLSKNVINTAITARNPRNILRRCFTIYPNKSRPTLPASYIAANQSTNQLPTLWVIHHLNLTHNCCYVMTWIYYLTKRQMYAGVKQMGLLWYTCFPLAAAWVTMWERI